MSIRRLVLSHLMCSYFVSKTSCWKTDQCSFSLALSKKDENHSIADESQRQMLVNVSPFSHHNAEFGHWSLPYLQVSKSFAEGNITLEKYVTTVKGLVGLRLLVEAVAIGKAKEDLTVLTSGPKKANGPGLRRSCCLHFTHICWDSESVKGKKFAFKQSAL